MSISALFPEKTWHKENYLISTSLTLLDHDLINATFASDDIYWTNRMNPTRLKKMLDLSLCFGVYELPQQSDSSDRDTRPPQIGLARLVTDTISHAYLTDVFILPAHRNHGLGRWLLECVNETVVSWPDLRRFCLFTSGAVARRFYGEALGMVEFDREVGGHEEHGQGRRGGSGGRGEFLVFPENKDLGGLEFMCQDRGLVEGERE